MTAATVMAPLTRTSQASLRERWPDIYARTVAQRFGDARKKSPNAERLPQQGFTS